MLARIRCIKIRRLSTLRLVTTCGSIILLRCCPLLCLHSCYAMHIFLYFSSLSPSIHSPAYTFTLDPPRVDIHSIFLTGSQGVASESLSDIFKSDVCEKETRESTRASKRARNQTMYSHYHPHGVSITDRGVCVYQCTPIPTWFECTPLSRYPWNSSPIQWARGDVGLKPSTSPMLTRTLIMHTSRLRYRHCCRQTHKYVPPMSHTQLMSTSTGIDLSASAFPGAFSSNPFRSSQGPRRCGSSCKTHKTWHTEPGTPNLAPNGLPRAHV